MTVFKACIKILRKNSLLLVIYFGIFTLMALSVARQTEKMAEKAYETEGVRLSVINRDDSEYAESLENYLSSKTELTDIVETEEGIADALFYRYTEYVVVIPDGFGDALASGGDVSIDKYEVSDSYSGVFMDNMINEYVKRMKIYGAAVPEQEETAVEMLGADEHENGSVYIGNFSAYSFMTIIIFGVGTILAAFRREDIRKRNMVSPVSGVRTAVSQMAAALMFTLAVWLLTITVSVLVLGRDRIDAAEVYMAFNMLIYAFVCLTMGFCISTVISSANGRNMVTNVIALGFSFIGGVMVPLDMLGENVKLIGSFTPAYWFVKANGVLAEATEFAASGLSAAWRYIGIELLFAAAFLTIGLAAARKQS